MHSRRELLGTVGALTAVTVTGQQGVERVRSSGPSPQSGDDDAAGPAETPVAFARNVEEIKGHLTSSVTLLERDRSEDAALHAGHATDYFGPVLTPLRDVNPQLATQLRGRLSGIEAKVRSLDVDEYETYVNEELFALLDQAVNAVVPKDTRDSPTFDVEVINALAGRIAEEYTAAVPSAGTIELTGEYWDARGFLTRIEQRYTNVESEIDGAGSDALEQLRQQIEDIAAATAVLGTTLSVRVQTAAAAPLPTAQIEDRSEAVTYVRNVEELAGHLTASATLLQAGDASAAKLHAGHATDYVLPLLPAVRRSNPDLADQLLDQLLTVDDRVSDGPESFRQYLETEVKPQLQQVPAVAVPEQFNEGATFSVSVVLELLDRIEAEYTAAVTEDEVIERYGEYWDARGFFTRIETRYDGVKSAFDSETQTNIESTLETLRTELETAAPPSDITETLAALTELLSGAAVDA